MKDEKSIQLDILDDIMSNITNLYKYCISLEERVGDLECKRDEMESDITFLFHLMHGGDNFCGNCEHCIPCLDGLYRCDLTNLELDPDTSSCIRFKCPQIPKSDAEICKACSDKDTPRCYKCSHFPF